VRSSSASAVIYFTAWSKLLTTLDAPAVIDPKPDIGRKSRFLRQLAQSPSEYWQRLVRKNRMVWRPDGEKNFNICLFISTEYMNVTDGQTDTAGRHRPRLCIASRGKSFLAKRRSRSAMIDASTLIIGSCRILNAWCRFEPRLSQTRLVFVRWTYVSWWCCECF